MSPMLLCELLREGIQAGVVYRIVIVPLYP
jgi:hypothetical protein